MTSAAGVARRSAEWLALEDETRIRWAGGGAGRRDQSDRHGVDRYRSPAGPLAADLALADLAGVLASPRDGAGC